MALRLLDVSRRRRIALKLVEYPDLETVYPFHPATIVLQLSAADLELALEFARRKSPTGIDGCDLRRTNTRLQALELSKRL